MKRFLEFERDIQDMHTIMQLTSAFEGLASLHIARIRDQVLQAQAFFHELWNIYTQLRIDSLFRYGRINSDHVINKQLYIIITASGGFTGDIDQRLIAQMLEKYDPLKQDIIVVGRHGSILLTQQRVAFKKYFKLPEKDQNINVEPLIREIRQYENTHVFYQSYLSLNEQSVKEIDVSVTIQELSKQASPDKEVISEKNYIFEPSAYAVMSYLERSMLQIALSQVLFDSKLAQYASRFQAMSIARDRATDSLGVLKSRYNRAKLARRDEETKQIINVLRRVSVS